LLPNDRMVQGAFRPAGGQAGTTQDGVRGAGGLRMGGQDGTRAKGGGFQEAWSSERSAAQHARAGPAHAAKPCPQQGRPAGLAGWLTFKVAQLLPAIPGVAVPRHGRFRGAGDGRAVPLVPAAGRRVSMVDAQT
jgi:hypothetical protein